jgi:hypothetical protein
MDHLTARQRDIIDEHARDIDFDPTDLMALGHVMHERWLETRHDEPALADEFAGILSAIGLGELLVVDAGVL